LYKPHFNFVATLCDNNERSCLQNDFDLLTSRLVNSTFGQGRSKSNTLFQPFCTISYKFDQQFSVILLAEKQTDTDTSENMTSLAEVKPDIL